jgi:hypothetical protein
MNKDFNTKTYILLLCLLFLSLASLTLSVWTAYRVHPPKPVVISCDLETQKELERAGEQLEKVSNKIVQQKR